MAEREIDEGLYEILGLNGNRVKVLTHLDKKKFLKHLEFYGDTKTASGSFGIPHFVVEHNIDADEEFGEQVDIIINRNRARIMKRLNRLALFGRKKPIVGGKDRDEIIAYEDIPNERALELLVKMRFLEAEKYNNNDKPRDKIANDADFSRLSRKERKYMHRLIEKAQQNGE